MNMNTKMIVVALAALASATSFAADYPIHPAEMTNVAIRAGFWYPRFETNRVVTVQVDFRKSEDTGRISNFELAGERAGRGFQGIPFNDSDVYKIIEGAAYTLSTHPDPKLEKYLDDLIDKIANAVAECGAFIELLNENDDVVDKHWILDLLTHPNDRYNRSRFLYAWATNYNVFGDAFVYFDRNAVGSKMGQIRGM